MSYTLTFTQQRAFLWTVNVYSLLTAPGQGGDFGVYNTSPKYVALPVLYDVTPETDEPRDIGRSKTVNFFTLDKFFYPAQESDGTLISIADTDAFKMTGGPVGCSVIGKWWVVNGDDQNWAAYAHLAQVLAKRVKTAPSGLAGL